MSVTMPDAIAGPLRRLSNRYAESPIPGFLRWWGSSLRSCLPARLRETMAAEAAQLELRLHSDRLLLRRSDAADDTTIELPIRADDDLAAAFDQACGDALRNLPRVLLLPDSKVLQRHMNLPAATADNLRAVVGYELDRQTPFKPAQVYYDCRIVGRDSSARQIDVNLVLCPKTQLDAELARLGRVAEGIDAVDVVDADGHAAGCNLLPAERRARRGYGQVWLLIGLVAFIVVMLSLAGSGSLANRRAAVASLEEAVDAQRVEARRVNQMREKLSEAVEGANFLAVHRAEAASVLDLLNELTYRLPPETTYLERLSLSGDKLSISGQSSQAAELVGLLQPSAQIRSVSLSGSIQPDARSGKDRFNIAAEYRVPEGGIQRDYRVSLGDEPAAAVADPVKAAQEASADQPNPDEGAAR